MNRPQSKEKLAMSLLKRLNIKLPVIQAPMAGGVVTKEMIAAVTRSGGLGSLPLGYLTMAETEIAIRQTQSMIGNCPFAVNVFMPAAYHSITQDQENKMLNHVNIYRRKLALSDLKTIPLLSEASAYEQINFAVSEGVKIISFTFGALSKEKINILHSENVFVIGTATNVEEGIFLEVVGCDAVVAQGAEAGGHRGGGFLANKPGGLIPTSTLVSKMKKVLSIPIIAAGGIMDGARVVDMLNLGASAVQLGTFFLAANESNAELAHKEALAASAANATCITKAFTGKEVRAFKNAFVRDTEGLSVDSILPYPIQHQVTKEFRALAAKHNQNEYASFWAGTGHQFVRTGSVTQLMDELINEMNHSLDAL